MKYVIQYNYDWYDLGCGCCSDSSSEIHIYEAHRVEEGVYTSYFDNPGYLTDEDYLRQWVNDVCPEFNDFTVHPDTQFA